MISSPRPVIIVVTGIMGAGKSTVGRMLAARFERGAHVEADVLHSMIVSGDAWATETSRPGEPPGPETAKQLRLRLRNACVVARNLRDAGFTPVIDDIIAGERWDHLSEDLAGQPFRFVVLALRVDVVVQREAWRGTNLGEDWAYYLDGELRRTMAGVGMWVDSSDQTPEETVDEILRRIPDEGLIEFGAAMDPEIETANKLLQTKIREVLDSVRSLDGDALNRAPGLPGANSPFVIVTHVFGNMRAWVIGIACGHDLGRDRRAEFRSSGTFDDLAAAGARLEQDMATALEALDPATLGDRFLPRQELFGEGTLREVSRREALLHPLEHAGIHLGHIHMTVATLDAGL